MANCELISGCDFFNDMMTNMPVMANILRKKYCRGEPLKCARYEVFLKNGPGSVPSDLYPSHHERAARLTTEGTRPSVPPAPATSEVILTTED